MNQLKHVAFIMDGNRRWADKQGLEQIAGHRQGVEVLKQIVNHAKQHPEIEVMSFWAFSTKNFRRPKNFLQAIFRVFRETLRQQEWLDSLLESNVRLRTIGRLELFPEDVVKQLKQALARFDQLSQPRLTVNLALGYEGRDEILRAVARLAKSGVDWQKLTPEQFSAQLDTAGQPDPDLLIRTGGEIRLSGFMPWQTTDTELYFTSTLWPDFGVTEFEQAIEQYHNRKRNFGK